MSRITVETGVFVDYIDRKSPYHEQVKAIMDSLSRIEILLPPVTLAEICYVTARILQEAGIQDAFDKAVQFVNWLYSHPAVIIINELDLHVEAVRIKLKYKIALSYCYVLALSKLKSCKAVFRKREKEMSRDVENDFDVLEDY